MRKILTGILCLLGLIGALYYFFFYPPTLYRRAAQQLLDSFSVAVNNQSPKDLQSALNVTFSDDATVMLKVGFPAMPASQMKEILAENFTKPEFLQFIDNTLYSLSEYHHSASVDSILLNPDQKTGTLVFRSEGKARDNATLSSSVKNILRADSLCSADVTFNAERKPVITKLSCVTQLH